jgi:zinc protease
MNAAFGGLFTSRINQNLREDKGYTYGVYSGFGTTARRAPSSSPAACAPTSRAPR